MKQFYILFFFNLFFQLTNAQSSVDSQFYGKIAATYPDLEGITVYNLHSELAVISEKKGFFTITAKVGDTLQLTAVQLTPTKYVVKKNDLTNKIVEIKMELQNNQLKEVIVNEYGAINEISLGLVPANQKQYTVAERRLKTAGEFKPTSIIGIIAGGMDVDALINAISGRTKQLKKELENERKTMLKDKITNLYTANYFTEVLKIPSEYVDGFKFYAVENTNLMQAISNKNKAMTSFLLIEIAEEYKELIKEQSSFWKMKNSIRYTIGFLLFVVLTSMTSHKFYVSMYQVNYVSQKKMVQITSRIFIDDLNEALEKKYKKKAYVGTDRQTDSDIELMKKYISEKCIIKINGQQKSFNYLSNELEANVIVCYYSIKEIAKINSLSIENTALMEINGDQQNVIQANIDGDKKSLLLTADNFKGILK